MPKRAVPGSGCFEKPTVKLLLLTSLCLLWYAKKPLWDNNSKLPARQVERAHARLLQKEDGGSNVILERPRIIPLPVPELRISYIAGTGGSSKYPAGLSPSFSGHSHSASAGASSRSPGRSGESVVGGERRGGQRFQPAKSRRISAGRVTSGPIFPSFVS